jgi:hypothetical protein
MSAEALDAQRLLELSQAAVDVDHADAVKAEAGTLTGTDLDASIAAHRECAQACEAFRRRYYPRSGRVIAALGGVHVMSPKGRRGRIVAEVQR